MRSVTAARNYAMSQCTAPVRGHSSSAAAAACPACRNRYGRGYGYGGGYAGPSYPSYSSVGSGSSYRGSGGGSSSGGSRPRWSRAGSTVSYTPAQVQSLTPVREPLRKLLVISLICATASCATHGLIGWAQPRNLTMHSRRQVSRRGSANWTWASGCR